MGSQDSEQQEEPGLVVDKRGFGLKHSGCVCGLGRGMWFESHCSQARKASSCGAEGRDEQHWGFFFPHPYKHPMSSSTVELFGCHSIL